MLRDVKAPVDYPFSFPILVVFTLLGLAVIIFFIVFWLKRKHPKKIVPEVTMTPWDKALDSLEGLRISNFLSIGKFEKYYLILSGIVRTYCEERFHIHAPEMTTEEFLSSLRDSSELQDKHKETLKEFMISCDMVKFAKYTPQVAEAQKSFELAKRIVEETKGTTPSAS